MAALGGCDAIVFTAGIGENSAYIRARILDGLEGLGVEMDATRNTNPNAERDYRISADGSRIQSWVIATNGELVIALDAAKIATASKQSPWV